MYQFNDIYGYGKPIIFIHPFKQQVVKKLVEHICPAVTHVIIFGSATLPACRYDSDVDVCLIGDVENMDTSKLLMSGQAYDIVKYHSLTELRQKAESSFHNISKEIYTKGVVVYHVQQHKLMA